MGRQVKLGDVIGTVGNTGKSPDGVPMADHLHLVLYQKIGEAQKKRLEQGRSPSSLSGKETEYAAPFYLEPKRTLENYSATGGASDKNISPISASSGGGGCALTPQGTPVISILPLILLVIGGFLLQLKKSK